MKYSQETQMTQSTLNSTSFLSQVISSISFKSVNKNLVFCNTLLITNIWTATDPCVFLLYPPAIGLLLVSLLRKSEIQLSLYQQYSNSTQGSQ